MQIAGEDARTTEALQSVALQNARHRDAADHGPEPILGAQEQRIAWFDAAYRAAMDLP